MAFTALGHIEPVEMPSDIPRTFNLGQSYSSEMNLDIHKNPKYQALTR